MIFNLQILRALAAIGVVIYHIDFCFMPGVHTEFLGVATFFVISGFVMCLITEQNADNFVLNRAVRIIPLYWLMTFGLAIFWRSSWLYVLRSLSFFPSDQPPILHVGWTLNFEVYFYAIFAVSLWISQRWAPLSAAAVILAVAVVNHVAPGIFLTRYYSHMYIMFFLDGIALFYGFRMARGRLPRIVALPAAMILIGCYLIQIDMPAPGAWTYRLPPMIVGSALLMTAAGADIAWRPLTLLGDASYALYLTHTSVMGILRRVTPHFLDAAKTDVAPFLILLAMCIAVGIAVHLWIEKPLLRAIRTALAADQKPRFTAPRTLEG